MMECPPATDFERHRRGLLDPETERRFEEHLASCERCRERSSSASGSLTPESSRPHEHTLSFSGSTEANQKVSERKFFPRIEGYEIIGVLGSGGMGVVYEATQAKLARKVALKLLPAMAGAANPQLVQRFTREATAAAKLHHTNIIPIYDFGESRDGYYYAMELIHGKPMSEMIRRFAAMDPSSASLTAIAKILNDGSTPQPPDTTADEPSSDASSTHSGSSSWKGKVYYRQVATWMADAADALHYAHLHGMVHRDIKPSNLMLTTEGRIIVVDFGLVKVEGSGVDLTVSGAQVGTRCYMSPEQISGAKRLIVDQRTDIYSLGAVLYELLVFRRAFSQTTDLELNEAIHNNEYTRPKSLVPSIPDDLETICVKAMQWRAKDRYPTAKDMAEDLRKFLDDLPIKAKKSGMKGTLTKFARRHVVELRMLAATVVLLLATWLVWGWVEDWRAEQMVKEGDRRYDQEDYDGAENLYTQALGIRHNDTSIKGRLDSAFMAKHGIKTQEDRANAGALPKGLTVAQVEAEDAALLVNMGISAMGMKDYPNASMAFEDSLKIQPDNFRANYNFATLKKDRYYDTHEEHLLNEAFNHVEKAMEVAGGRTEIWNLRGVLNRVRGNYAGALRDLDKAIEIKNDYAPNYVNLGSVLALLKDIDGSITAHRKALELDPKSVPMAYVNLASVEHLVSESESTGTLSKFAAIEKSVYALLLRARMQLDRHDEGGVILALQDATLANTSGGEPPRAGRVKRILAWAQLESSNWAAARESAEKAIELGDQPVAYAHLILAAAHAKEGNANEAHKHFDLGKEESWPAELRAPDGYLVSIDKTTLWYDTARELRHLQEKAKSLMAEGP